MAKRKTAQFRNTILCEDVRKEVNGKHTIVGVFSGGILVPSFPAQVRLAIYTEYVPVEIGENSVTFRISYGAGRAAEFRGTVSVTDAKDAVVLVIPNISASFKEAGEMKFDVSLDGKKWINLIRTSVSVGPVESLFGSPPPG